jgi:hypothetical protein
MGRDHDEKQTQLLVCEHAGVWRCAPAVRDGGHIVEEASCVAHGEAARATIARHIPVL